jgi:hypothetical protein
MTLVRRLKTASQKTSNEVADGWSANRKLSRNGVRGSWKCHRDFRFLRIFQSFPTICSFLSSFSIRRSNSLSLNDDSGFVREPESSKYFLGLPSVKFRSRPRCRTLPRSACATAERAIVSATVCCFFRVFFGKDFSRYFAESRRSRTTLRIPTLAGHKTFASNTTGELLALFIRCFGHRLFGLVSHLSAAASCFCLSWTAARALPLASIEKLAVRSRPAANTYHALS